MDKELQDRLNELERRMVETKGSITPAQNKIIKLLPLVTAGHLLFAVPAMIGSLALAYFAFVQADATRKMQIGSAMPFVTYGTSNVDDEGNEEISLTLANNGVGPAIMGPLEIRYRGEPMQDAAQLLERCCGMGPGSKAPFMTSPSSDVAVRPGENVKFFRLKRTAQNGEVWERLNAERWNLEVRACYCSIYKDCWTIEGAQAIPSDEARCPADWNVFARRGNPARARPAVPPQP